MSNHLKEVRKFFEPDELNCPFCGTPLQLDAFLHHLHCPNKECHVTDYLGGTDSMWKLIERQHLVIQHLYLKLQRLGVFTETDLMFADIFAAVDAWNKERKKNGREETVK